EDGIRDGHVTGVQCALPIYLSENGVAGFGIGNRAIKTRISATAGFRHGGIDNQSGGGFGFLWLLRAGSNRGCLNGAPRAVLDAEDRKSVVEGKGGGVGGRRR